MKFRILSGLLGLLVIFSCNQQQSNSKTESEQGISQEKKSTGNLTIENGHYRGMVYVDSIGNKYTLRYIPIKITNENSKQAQILLNFEREYQYPGGGIDEKFNIIPLPTEWGLDGVAPSESMKQEIGKYILNPTSNFTIEPNEKYTIAIGALNRRDPPQNGGIEPKILFVQDDKAAFKDCNWILEQEGNENPKEQLGLTLKSDRCSIIPCGAITYVGK